MRFLQRAVFTLSCWDRRATPEFDTDKIDARMGDFIPIYIYAYIYTSIYVHLHAAACLGHLAF
jgi:hypothetical protein